MGRLFLLLMGTLRGDLCVWLIGYSNVITYNLYFVVFGFETSFEDVWPAVFISA